jgi:acyl carrier protein
MTSATNASDVLATIQKIIGYKLKMDPAKVLPASHLQKDLGAESLDALEIIMSIEEAFNIAIPDEEVYKAQTVQDIVCAVQIRMVPV